METTKKTKQVKTTKEMEDKEMEDKEIISKCDTGYSELSFNDKGLLTKIKQYGKAKDFKKVK